MLGGAGGYAQLVTASGGVFRLPDAKIPLPSVGATQVAAGTRDPYFEDATVADTHVRILTARYAPGIAIQIARPLDEVDKTLDRLAGYPHRDLGRPGSRSRHSSGCSSRARPSRRSAG